MATLSLAAEKLRRELVRCYGAGPDVEKLAEVAAASWDRAEQAGARVDAEGLTITNGKGTFANPSATIERQSRLAFMSAIRALRQLPRRDKLGRPSKHDQITQRFFGKPSALAKKYFTPPV